MPSKYLWKIVEAFNDVLFCYYWYCFRNYCLQCFEAVESQPSYRILLLSNYVRLAFCSCE